MRLVVLYCILLFTGCAIPLHQQYKVLDAEKVCCSTYQEMGFTEALTNEESFFILGKGTQTFHFDQGKSYFKSFKVHEGNGDYQIRSYFNGSMIGQYVSPIILELDSEFGVLSHRELTMHFVPIIYFEDAHMQANFSLQKQTKYLVIYPSNNNQNTPTAKVESGGYAYMAGNTPVVVQGGSSTHKLEKAPTGELKILPEKN